MKYFPVSPLRRLFAGFTLVFRRTLVGASLLAFCLGSSALGQTPSPIPTGAPEYFPPWWFQNNVIARTDSSNGHPAWPGDYPVADDFAPLVRGQLLNLLSGAIIEFQALPATPALALDSAVAALLANPNASPDNLTTINLGQLKYTVQPFYDKLTALGLASRYPWANSPNPADDYSLATLGQAKMAFSFTLDPTWNGLVGRWKFDDGAGPAARDSWRHAYTGTLTAQSWSSTAFEGAYSLKFNGGNTAQCLTIPNSAGQIFGANAQQPLSIAFWFLPQPVPENTAYSLFNNAANEASGGHVSGFRCTLDNDYWSPGTAGLARLRFWTTQDNGNIDLDSDPNENPIDPVHWPTQWHHFAVTYGPNPLTNGADSVATLYVDGQQAAQQTSATLVENTQALLVGQKIVESGTGTILDFNGNLDDLRIYDVPLADADVQNLFNVDANGDGIPDWWEYKYFGTTTVDLTGNREGDGMTTVQEYQTGRNPLSNIITDTSGSIVGLQVYAPPN